MAELNDPRGDFNPYAPPAAFADAPPPDQREDDLLIPAERASA